MSFRVCYCFGMSESLVLDMHLVMFLRDVFGGKVY